MAQISAFRYVVELSDDKHLIFNSTCTNVHEALWEHCTEKQIIPSKILDYERVNAVITVPDIKLPEPDMDCLEHDVEKFYPNS